MSEKHEFKAEVSALLKLVTNSLYTNREIFLRELISNASDALDKARFAALVEDGVEGADLEAAIDIYVDAEAGTLTLEDNGIGLTRDEAARNLGTIAHSGTLEFLNEQAKNAAKQGDGKGLDLIGQFGVGFYSAFMVADRVDVYSRSARPGEAAIHWSSTGEGEFTLDENDKETRGTRIVLTLNEEGKEFTKAYRLREIVQRYSNYVMHPINLREREEGGEFGEAKKLNAASAIWGRSPRELSEEEYAEFYTHIMGGFTMPGDEALSRLHFSAEAPIQFSALLYLPGRAPADLFMEDRKALQLFARRVMVMESTDKLLPTYLRFFRGVVDSEDLPLNVSREMLQEHKSLSAIRRQLTRKCLKLLAELASENNESYEKFWREFGAVLKEGLHTDGGNREALTALLRYTSVGAEGLRSLDAYVEAMPEGQEYIYYVAGLDEAGLRASPHLEAVRAKGYEVLLMTDAVDEWVLQHLQAHKEKVFRSVSQGDLEGDASEEEAGPSAIDPLLERMRAELEGRVKDVRISKRLTDTAACLVDDAGGLSRNMERILRAASRDPDAPIPSSPRILEINADHPFVAKANELAQSENAQTKAQVGEYAELLLDLAALAEGSVLDPAGVVKRVQAVLLRSVS